MCSYEEQMFYFNTVTRVGRYLHEVRAQGIDYCYDCKAEVAASVTFPYLDRVDVGRALLPYPPPPHPLHLSSRWKCCAATSGRIDRTL